MTTAQPSRFYSLDRALKILGRPLDDLLHGAIHGEVLLCMNYAEALAQQPPIRTDGPLGSGGQVPVADREPLIASFSDTWAHVVKHAMPPGLWALPRQAFRRTPHGYVASTHEAYRLEVTGWRGIFPNHPLLVPAHCIFILRSEMHRLVELQKGGTEQLEATDDAYHPILDADPHKAPPPAPPAPAVSAESSAAWHIFKFGTKLEHEDLPDPDEFTASELRNDREALLNTIGALVALIGAKVEHADQDVLIRSLIKRFKGRPGIDTANLRRTLAEAEITLGAPLLPHGKKST